MYSALPAARHLGHHGHGDHHHHHHHGAGAEPEGPPTLAELTRGNLSESTHRGCVAVANPQGRVIAHLGHPSTPTFLRSAAKPLQSLPLVTSGTAQALGLTDEELACTCGSLNGQDFQVEAVRSILAKAGFDESHLACGTHWPFHRPTAQAMRKAGEKPQPVQNGCAGKHAAMLAMCAHLGHDPEGYYQPSHPVQKLILATISEMCAYPAEQIGIGVDGCGVPVFRVPLGAMAGAFARLAAPGKAGLRPELARAAEQIMAACLAHPRMIAGDERICTRIMEAAPGKVLAKTGSEGSYGLALVENGLGAAINIEDGSMRALPPVVTELCHQLGVLDHHALDHHLADLHQPKLTNYRGEVVAELKPVFNIGELPMG